MKGMDKILRGWTFRSALEYCEGRGDKEGAPEGRLMGGNMAGRTVRELLREFVAARRLRPDIEKATWHNSLRLPPGDRLSDERWREVADDYMRRMGFSPLHPYCIWAHDDESAVHIIASRIGFDGRVYLGQNENLASTRHIHDLEHAHGLRLTKGPEYFNPDDPPETRRPVPRERAGLDKPELEAAVRTGREPPKLRLQRLIDEAVADRPSVVELAERLAEEGVAVRANLASTGTFNGFAFELDGVPLKGSDLGKSYAWKGLQARGVTYEQTRDRSALERFRPAARAAEGNHGAAAADRSADPAGSGSRSDADAVGQGIDRVERWAASTGAGPGLADRTHSGPPGGDRDAPERAGRAPFQAGGGAVAGDGGVAAGADEGRPAGAAAPGGQPADDRSAGEGLGGEAADARTELTKDHQTKIAAWRRQAQALGAPAYRVTLKGRTGDAEGTTINLGKAKVEGQPERTYSAAEVEALIPQLRRRNAIGFDVYITPLDPAAHYLVIDDMKAGAAQLLEGLGHAPCLVQSSSAGNEQAVLKVPKVDRPDEQQLANKVVAELNRDHGDPKFSGVVHPFRMAGFSNKKPGKASAFTRLLLAVPRLCARAGELLQRLRDQADDLAERARKQRQRERLEAAALRQAELQRDRGELEVVFERDDDAERAFRRAAAGVRAWVKLRGLIEDASRVDYRACMAMLRAGFDEAQVRAGLFAGSDDLAQRHTNPEDYAERSVRKAVAALAVERASAARERSEPRRPGERGG